MSPTPAHGIALSASSVLPAIRRNHVDKCFPYVDATAEFCIVTSQRVVDRAFIEQNRESVPKREPVSSEKHRQRDLKGIETYLCVNE